MQSLKSQTSPDRDRRRNTAAQCNCGATAPAGRSRFAPMRSLQRIVGNQTVLGMLGAQPRQTGGISEKALDDAAAGTGLIDEQSPPATGGGNQPATAPAKTAGYDWFMVTWQKHPAAGPTNARFHVHYLAKFKDDPAHDPKCVDFRQSAMTKYEVISGPHQGDKADTSPLHDDHYSRDDDLAKRDRSRIDFESEDNPGVHRGNLAPDDVIDYAFTAQQMLIDTCQNDKVISTIGPHTVTITGQDPRTFTAVPEVFEDFG